MAFTRILKKIFAVLTSNKFILYIALILNVLLWIGLSVFISRWVYAYVVVFSIILTFFILAKSKEPIVYKISWIIIMIFLPIFGVAFYLYLKSSPITVRKQLLWRKIQQKNEQYLDKLAIIPPRLVGNQARLAKYIQSATGMPVYQDASLKYFASGEDFFEDFFKELEKAEKYIYLEFFIVRKGTLWNRLYEILEKKAKAGVDIKLLYDDYACIDVFKKKELKKLNECGICLRAFNKLRPYVTRFSNFRDHRKIVIIDGKVGYSGGMNLADEYANIIERFGYWKDTAIKVESKAIYSFLCLFATNWEIATGEHLDIINLEQSKKEIKDTGDCVQIFGSGPLDLEHSAKSNYDNMINLAQEHIYISTPYFVLDASTTNALKNASKSGVKIKIVLPEIPDKKFVYYVGQTFYRELLEQGIEIYELKNSFNHAKMVEIDGSTASIGTTNFDFRSLYLNYENTVMIYNSQTILEIKNDFEQMFFNSNKIELQNLKKDGFFKRIYVNFIKLFLPLL